MKIGIIQSRGMGDIIIALPIALALKEQGHEIVWPICEEFIPNLQRHVDWITWVPLQTDRQGLFFYDRPMQLLKYTTDEQLNLMQFLSSRPGDSDPDLFPILKFDQYKYATAGVPYRNKMRLGECITRDPAVEQHLKQLVVQGDRYIVTHLAGSDRQLALDFSDAEAQGYQVVNITERAGYSVFDWISVLEGAESLYLIDSCFANMVDQLDIGRDKWFIRRSKMDLTPVLLSDWQYFPVSQLSKTV
jgi:hypothetical protein